MKRILPIFICAILSVSLTASEDILLRLEGDFLAYSYDFNQIYGENVEFSFSSYRVSCQYLKVDLLSQIFYAHGDVILKKEEEELNGDEFLFNPKEKKGTLINYKEKIELKNIGDEKGESSLARNDILDELNLSEIQKSFIYFTGQLIEIMADYDIYGYNVTLFVEGFQSLGFKKFKLSEGIKQRMGGFSIDKIWYTKSQGIIARASYSYVRKDKVNSLTQLNYEEHSVLKNYSGAKRQVDVMTSTTLNVDQSLNAGMTGNYNSSNLWNTRLWLNKNWGGKIDAMVDFSYNKPINLKGEAWIGLQSNLNAGKVGTLSFLGRFELQNQILTGLSYTNTFFNKINLLLSSSYSQIRIGESQDYSKIFTGGVSLSYNTRIFNLSTDYYLNYDLFGNQLLSQPQLRFGLNPFSFYGGLLTANIYNVFIYNQLRAEDLRQYSYSNNTVFNLTTRPIYIQRNFNLNFNVALEQFLEKEGRNFTSGGFIIRAEKRVFKGVSLEGFYTIQSRRKTKGWLIEGTTSQDLSAVLNVNPSEKLNGWISFSYDPKNNQWRQSFADVSVGLIKNWKFHSLINYDFLLKKIGNVDLYLIRDAGRFQLRFIWRSLSKQFLVELVPR